MSMSRPSRCSDTPIGGEVQGGEDRMIRDDDAQRTVFWDRSVRFKQKARQDNAMCFEWPII